MTKRELILILHLTTVFVVGFALTTFLHELAHAAVAKIVNVDPVWYHTYVSYNNSTTPQLDQLYIAAAGPLFSLFQSFIFLGLLSKRTKVDLATLLYLWMCIIGMVVFLGYVMIGPFVPYGDTGKVYAILTIPMFVSYLFSAFALILIIFFFKKITPKIGSIINVLNTEMKYPQKKARLLLFVVPLGFGTILNVLISLPAPTTISLLFPITVSLTMLPTAIRLKAFILSSDNQAFSEKINFKSGYLPVFLLIIIIALSRILAEGVYL